MTAQRLFFIDAVRAFAILMMLQGHFIDTLLDVTYRDPDNMVFYTWKYFRGITAPIFFTISGLIFTYLLIKAKHQGKAYFRMRKGIMRGLLLIGIGYALRTPVFEWFLGIFRTYFLVVDVLQCIGLSLIAIVIIYALCLKRTIVFSILMLLIGMAVFITEPLYRDLELTNIPLVFANYMTKANGSIFTILPWFGYMAFGAFIATLFYGYLEKPRFKTYIITGFILFGLLLIFRSAYLFNTLYYATDIQLLEDVAYYNYLFTRLGNVLVVFAFFYTFEAYLKQSLILKIGQKTLSIYIIHFIIIYGSFTGLGLTQLIGKTLTPWQAIIGAVLFLISVCVISLYVIKPNTFVYSNIRRMVLQRKLKT